MSKTIDRKPVSWLKPDPNQPRKTFGEDALLRLGESLKVRQNEPLQAKSDGTIIDGERRWRAAKLVGLETLEVIVTDTPLSDTDLDVIRLTSFFHKEGLTDHDKWLAVTRLLCGNPRMQLKEAASLLCIDPSTVTRYVSPSRCVEAVQSALRDGRIGISDAYELSKLPQDRQAELLTFKRSRPDGRRVSRNALATTAKRLRTEADAATPKLARCRLPLPTGTTVTVQGPEMTLDGLIETLQAALEAARRAHRDSLDIRTAEKVWRDRSKAKKQAPTHDAKPHPARDLGRGLPARPLAGEAPAGTTGPCALAGQVE